MVKGSGIDWLSVSAEWEEEGLKLTKKDLASLAQATGRFVKLPNKGWVQLDENATQQAQEARPTSARRPRSGTQKIAMEQAAHLGEDSLAMFGDSKQAQKLRSRIETFEGIPAKSIPNNIQAELRPYQQQGFDFKAPRAWGWAAFWPTTWASKTLQTLTIFPGSRSRRNAANPIRRW